MNAKLLSILLSVHVITPSSNKKFATSFTATLSLRYPTAAFQFQIAKMSEQDTTCGDVDVDACADRKQLSKNALKKRWKKEAVERKKAEKVAMRAATDTSSSHSSHKGLSKKAILRSNQKKLPKLLFQCHGDVNEALQI
ncbi:hypothetical protein ACHAXH_007661, partial [Discostella pseudostelligera]